MKKKDSRSASDLIAGMQGGVDKISGVVNTELVEKHLGRNFVARSGEGYRMTFKRFKDDPTKGYFTFERTE